jgi:signal transduction histidine kinase
MKPRGGCDLLAKWWTFGLNAAQEDRFRQANLAADITQTRICILLILVPVLGLVVNDYSLLGLSGQFYGIQLLRFALCVYTILLLTNLRACPGYRSFDRAVFTWAVCIAVFIIGIAATRPHTFIAHIIVVILAILVTLLVIPNRFTNLLILSMLYAAGETLVITTLHPATPQATVTALLCMWTACVIAIAYGWQLHAIRRREFLAREEAQVARTATERELVERKHNEEALQLAYAEVEQQVRERTVALTQANLALSGSQEQLRHMATRLAGAEEQERQRISRELHDQVGQNLTAVSLALSALRLALASESSKALTARLNDASRLIEETTDHIRSLMLDLRPSMLDDYGILSAMQWYGARFEERTGITVEVSGKGTLQRFSTDIETALYRIAQEALTNIAKHAQAATVFITWETAPVVRLSVVDDGIGFDAHERHTGWGLMIMRERALAIGGALHIASQPQHGTRVTAVVGENTDA